MRVRASRRSIFIAAALHNIRGIRLTETDSRAEVPENRRWISPESAPIGFGWRIALSVFLLFFWGVPLNYTESAQPSLRLPLAILWIVAFLWVNVFNASTSPSELKSTLVETRVAASQVWRAAIVLGVLIFIARPWVWAYESEVCFYPGLVAHNFTVNRLEALGVLGLLASAVTSSVAYPLLEEVVFRKWLLRTITQRFGAIVGVLSTAALFAIGHIRPSTIGVDFLLGLLLGYAAITTGSIALPLFLHFVSNFALELLTTRAAQPFLIGGLDRGVFNCAPSTTIYVVSVLACFAFLIWQPPVAKDPA